MSHQRVRRKLALSLLYGALLLLPASAAGAEPSEVSVRAPATLLTGIVFAEGEGAYQQVVEVRGDELQGELTFQLPTPGTTAEPGPVVVLWQLRIDVSDAEFGDILNRLVGPPIVMTMAPDCDEAGVCELGVKVNGSIAPALEAADLDWVLHTRLAVSMTLVRTFGGGTLLQALAPGIAIDEDGGTLASPSPVDGRLHASAVIPAAGVMTAEIPGDEFGIGGPPYDWGTAVAEALENGTPSESAKAISTGMPSGDPNQDSGPTSNPAVVGLLVAVVLAAMLLFFRVRRRSGLDSDAAGGP